MLALSRATAWSLALHLKDQFPSTAAWCVFSGKVSRMAPGVLFGTFKSYPFIHGCLNWMIPNLYMVLSPSIHSKLVVWASRKVSSMVAIDVVDSWPRSFFSIGWNTQSSQPPTPTCCLPRLLYDWFAYMAFLSEIAGPLINHYLGRILKGTHVETFQKLRLVECVFFGGWRVGLSKTSHVTRDDQHPSMVNNIASQLSNEKGPPGCFAYIGDAILPSYRRVIS